MIKDSAFRDDSLLSSIINSISYKYAITIEVYVTILFVVIAMLFLLYYSYNKMFKD